MPRQLDNLDAPGQGLGSYLQHPERRHVHLAARVRGVGRKGQTRPVEIIWEGGTSIQSGKRGLYEPGVKPQVRRQRLALIHGPGGGGW